MHRDAPVAFVIAILYLIAAILVALLIKKSETRLLILGLLTAIAAFLLGLVPGADGVSATVRPGPGVAQSAEGGWSLVGGGPLAALSKIAVLLILGALGIGLLKSGPEPAPPTTDAQGTAQRVAQGVAQGGATHANP